MQSRLNMRYGVVVHAVFFTRHFGIVQVSRNLTETLRGGGGVGVWHVFCF